MNLKLHLCVRFAKSLASVQTAVFFHVGAHSVRPLLGVAKCLPTGEQCSPLQYRAIICRNAINIAAHDKNALMFLS